MTIVSNNNHEYNNAENHSTGNKEEVRLSPLSFLAECKEIESPQSLFNPDLGHEALHSYTKFLESLSKIQNKPAWLNDNKDTIDKVFQSFSNIDEDNQQVFTLSDRNQAILFIDEERKRVVVIDVSDNGIHQRAPQIEEFEVDKVRHNIPRIVVRYQLLSEYSNLSEEQLQTVKNGLSDLKRQHHSAKSNEDFLYALDQYLSHHLEKARSPFTDPEYFVTAHKCIPDKGCTSEKLTNVLSQILIDKQIADISKAKNLRQHISFYWKFKAVAEIVQGLEVCNCHDYNMLNAVDASIKQLARKAYKLLQAREMDDDEADAVCEKLREFDLVIQGLMDIDKEEKEDILRGKMLDNRLLLDTINNISLPGSQSKVRESSDPAQPQNTIITNGESPSRMFLDDLHAAVHTDDIDTILRCLEKIKKVQLSRLEKIDLYIQAIIILPRPSKEHKTIWDSLTEDQAQKASSIVKEILNDNLRFTIRTAVLYFSIYAILWNITKHYFDFPEKKPFKANLRELIIFLKSPRFSIDDAKDQKLFWASADYLLDNLSVKTLVEMQAPVTNTFFSISDFNVAENKFNKATELFIDYVLPKIQEEDVEKIRKDLINGLLGKDKPDTLEINDLLKSFKSIKEYQLSKALFNKQYDKDEFDQCNNMINDYHLTCARIKLVRDEILKIESQIINDQKSLLNISLNRYEPGIDENIPAFEALTKNIELSQVNVEELNKKIEELQARSHELEKELKEPLRGYLSRFHEEAEKISLDGILKNIKGNTFSGNFVYRKVGFVFCNKNIGSNKVFEALVESSKFLCDFVGSRSAWQWDYELTHAFPKYLAVSEDPYHETFQNYPFTNSVTVDGITNSCNPVCENGLDAFLVNAIANPYQVLDNACGLLKQKDLLFSDDNRNSLIEAFTYLIFSPGRLLMLEKPEETCRAFIDSTKTYLSNHVNVLYDWRNRNSAARQMYLLNIKVVKYLRDLDKISKEQCTALLDEIDRVFINLFQTAAYNDEDDEYQEGFLFRELGLLFEKAFSNELPKFDRQREEVDQKRLLRYVIRTSYPSFVKKRINYLSQDYPIALSLIDINESMFTELANESLSPFFVGENADSLNHARWELCDQYLICKKLNLKFSTIDGCFYDLAEIPCIPDNIRNHALLKKIFDGKTPHCDVTAYRDNLHKWRANYRFTHPRSDVVLNYVTLNYVAPLNMVRTIDQISMERDGTQWVYVDEDLVAEVKKAVPSVFENAEDVTYWIEKDNNGNGRLIVLEKFSRILLTGLIENNQLIYLNRNGDADDKILLPCSIAHPFEFAEKYPIEVVQNKKRTHIAIPNTKFAFVMGGNGEYRWTSNDRFCICENSLGDLLPRNISLLDHVVLKDDEGRLKVLLVENGAPITITELDFIDGTFSTKERSVMIRLLSGFIKRGQGVEALEILKNPELSGIDTSSNPLSKQEIEILKDVVAHPKKVIGNPLLATALLRAILILEKNRILFEQDTDNDNEITSKKTFLTVGLYCQYLKNLQFVNSHGFNNEEMKLLEEYVSSLIESLKDKEFEEISKRNFPKNNVIIRFNLVNRLLKSIFFRHVDSEINRRFGTFQPIARSHRKGSLLAHKKIVKKTFTSSLFLSFFEMIMSVMNDNFVPESNDLLNSFRKYINSEKPSLIISEELNNPIKDESFFKDNLFALYKLAREGTRDEKRQLRTILTFSDHSRSVSIVGDREFSPSSSKEMMLLIKVLDSPGKFYKIDKLEKKVLSFDEKEKELEVESEKLDTLIKELKLYRRYPTDELVKIYNQRFGKEITKDKLYWDADDEVKKVEKKLLSLENEIKKNRTNLLKNFDCSPSLFHTILVAIVSFVRSVFKNMKHNFQGKDLSRAKNMLKKAKVLSVGRRSGVASLDSLSMEKLKETGKKDQHFDNFLESLAEKHFKSYVPTPEEVDAETVKMNTDDVENLYDAKEKESISKRVKQHETVIKEKAKRYNDYVEGKSHERHQISDRKTLSDDIQRKIDEAGSWSKEKKSSLIYLAKLQSSTVNKLRQISEGHDISIEWLQKLSCNDAIAQLKEELGVSEEQAVQILTYLAEYLITETRIQQLKMLKSYVDNGHSDDEIYETLSSLRRAYTPFDSEITQFSLLWFEFKKHYMIRQEQMEKIREILDNSKGADIVLEAGTGFGKTSTVIPAAAKLIAETTGNLVILAWPSALVKENRLQLENTFSLAFAENTGGMSFQRNSKLNSKKLKLIYRMLKQHKSDGTPVNICSESGKSFLLHHSDLLNALEKEKQTKGPYYDELCLQEKYFSKILTLTGNQGIVFVDECHDDLDPKNRLIYSVGSEASLTKEVTRDFADFIQSFNNTPVSSGLTVFETLQQGGPERLRDEYDDLVKLFVEGWISKLGLFEDDLPRVREYVVNGKPNPFEGKKTIKTDPSIEERVYLLKGMVADEILYDALSLEYNRHYGFSELNFNRYPFSIPYHGAKSPTETPIGPSQFSNLHKTLLLTSFAYSINGLRSGGERIDDYQVIQFIKKMIEQCHDEKTACKAAGTQVMWKETKTYKTFCSFFPEDAPKKYLECFTTAKLDKLTLDEVKELHQILYKRQDVIEKFVLDVVIPTVKTHPETLECSFANFLSMFKGSVSLSATPMDPKSYRLDAKLFEMDHTSEKVIENILRHSEVATINGGSSEEFLEQIARPINETPNCAAVIDIPGLFKDVANEEVAKAFDNSLNDTVDRVTFYDDKRGGFVKLDRKTKLIDKDAVDILEPRFAFYDQPRTVGSDIKLAKDGTAIVLATPTTPITKIGQGIGRMRQLGKNQKIRFLIPESTLKTQKITKEELVQRWIVELEAEEARRNTSSACQLIDDMIESEVRKTLQSLESSKAATCQQKNRNLFIKEHDVSAKSLYGKETTTIAGYDLVIKHIDSRRKLLRQISGLTRKQRKSIDNELAKARKTAGILKLKNEVKVGPDSSATFQAQQQMQMQMQTQRETEVETETIQAVIPPDERKYQFVRWTDMISTTGQLFTSVKIGKDQASSPFHKVSDVFRNSESKTIRKVAALFSDNLLVSVNFWHHRQRLYGSKQKPFHSYIVQVTERDGKNRFTVTLIDETEAREIEYKAQKEAGQVKAALINLEKGIVTPLSNTFSEEDMKNNEFHKLTAQIKILSGNLSKKYDLTEDEAAAFKHHFANVSVKEKDLYDFIKEIVRSPEDLRTVENASKRYRQILPKIFEILGYFLHVKETI
ncbi:MAG: DUF3638 domain-containing protein [Chlamydiales bacterium]|nr:DUF3638 domain-containing protein [Chlamydiales bacterium]